MAQLQQASSSMDLTSHLGSAISGVTSIPFMGFYSASKFALEGYSEALRMELEPFNIHVSLTEAGFLKTPMMDKRQVSAARLAEYDPWRNRAFSAIRNQEERGPGPQLAAETILRIISSKTPRLHYLVGPQAKFVSGAKWFLPEGAYERAKMGSFGLRH
jgi:short-subunit dehydrogenase